MIRRYAVSPLHCLAVVGLAVVGVVAALAGGLLVSLVVTYPVVATGWRRLAILGRRLAREWGDVPITAAYRPDPPAPLRRDDGWYVHDDQLYRSARMPAFLMWTRSIVEDPRSRATGCG